MLSREAARSYVRQRHKVRKGGRSYVYLRLVEAYGTRAARYGTGWWPPWAGRTS